MRDCRHFSGYKPCGFNSDCNASCPYQDIVEERILIVHLEALGAVLRATCILKPLKNLFPKSHITWITSPLAASLLENNPYIDRVIKNDHRGCLEISSQNFTHTYCIDKSAEAYGITRLPIHVGEVKGFGIDHLNKVTPLNEAANELFELGLSNQKKFFENTKAETQLLTEALELPYSRDNYVFEFTTQENEIIRSERKRLKITERDFVIGLNTGCSNVIPYKKFSIPGWQKLIEKILKDFPKSKILLLGGPEDTQRNHELFNYFPQIISTPTELGLRQGMSFVSLCDAVVTGDSLGMHMSIALKKFTVAWFGPTCAQEIDFFDNGIAIKSKAPCAPCWKRECSKEEMCYDLVDTEEIVKALLDFKNKKERLRPWSSSLKPKEFHADGTKSHEILF